MHDQLYIDGHWRPSRARAVLPVIDPATEETFHSVAAGGAEDIDAAVSAARHAFNGAWRRTTGRERAAYLRAFAQCIRRERERLARLEVRDNGKPLPEALWDIDDAAGCFEMYASLAEALDDRPRQPIPLQDDRFTTHVVREPVGVAGLIIPWNYPLLMAAWKVAPALAAGATAVLKPSELTPLTALELAAMAQEIQLPAGVLNVVTGSAAAGAALAAHRGVDKIAFTGSVPTGRSVMVACAQDIKNVSLELGGKSPFIVFDDADFDAAVEWILFGIFWNQGQVCSATSRLLVEHSRAPMLRDRLVQEVRRIRIGAGLDEGVLLGPLVSAAQHQRVSEHVARALADGARLLTGGQRPPQMRRGFFYEPTVLADVPRDSHAWNEEIFGPVLCVNTFSTEEQAVAMANDSSFGLAAAVMSADDERCERVAAALRAGVVWINCSQPTFSEAPWGGMKSSGLGRELGQWGLANYQEIKQITRYVSPERWGWYLGT